VEKGRGRGRGGLHDAVLREEEGGEGVCAAFGRAELGDDELIDGGRRA